MALHVTPVASVSLTEPAASIRRPAAGYTRAGQSAGKAATAALAPQASSSFDSLLANNSPARRPAAAIVNTVAKRTAAAAVSNAAIAASSPKVAANGSSDFKLLFGGGPHKPVASPGAITAVPSDSSSAAGTDATTTSTAGASGLSDFELLFGGSSYNPANPMVASATPSTSPTSTAKALPPTAESVFGANVWMSDPIGLTPDGSSFGYNPFYFATPSTAQTVAQMIGGTVVARNMFTQPGNAFVQQQPNYMVRMPDGALINPGLVASFYTFGFPQSQINTMIAQEVANTPPPAQTT